MTNVSKTSALDKFRPSESWSSPGVLHSPVDVSEFTIRVEVKTSAEIGINEFVEMVEVAGDETDLRKCTVAADNSITVSGYVLNNEHNREMLARDNSEDSYQALTKSTAKFTAGTKIDVLIIVPGMVLAHKLVANCGAAGLKFYTRVQSAGSGAVDVYATAFAAIGRLLCQAYHVAATQWVPILITLV